MLSYRTIGYREVIHTREKSIDMANFIFRNYSQNLFSEITMETPTFSNHYPDKSAIINTQVRPFTRKNIMTC